MAPSRPRAIWTGNISFGLVNAPVRMYAAVSESNLKFNLIHEKDGGRIGYQKICKLEDKPVPNDEIVKAYQVDDDEFVYLTDEDFAAASPEAYKTITIRDFVPADADRPDLLRAHLLPGSGRKGRRPGLRAAGGGDGEGGAGRRSPATCSMTARTSAACVSATAC